MSLASFRPTHLGAAFLTLVLLIVLGASATAAGGTINGSMFIDWDRDGRLDPGENVDPALAGLSVQAFDAAGVAAGGTTAADGSFAIPTTGLAGTDFRIEFPIPAGYHPTFSGALGNSVATSGTSTQFVSAPADVNGVVFGIVPESQCPDAGTEEEAGKLFVACFVNGDKDITQVGEPNDTVVSWNYRAPDPEAQAIPYDNVDHLNDAATVGSVWGLAYDEWDGFLYQASAVKRHADLGDAGVDGIYWQTFSETSGAPLPASTQSVNLGALPGSPSANAFGVDPSDCVSSPATDTADCRDLVGTQRNPGPSYDVWGLTRAGKYGIGDIDVTPDAKQLMVMNLTERALYTYELDSVTGAPTRYLSHVPLTNPSDPANVADTGCSNDEWAPWAIEPIDAESAYVGITCTAATSQDRNDLKAYVVKVEFAGANAGTETDVYMQPLNYDRGCSRKPGDTCNNHSDWRPWLDEHPAPHLIFRPPASAGTPWTTTQTQTTYPMPLLSDIEVEPADGSMTLSFINRFNQLLVGPNNFDGDPGDGDGFSYWKYDAGSGTYTRSDNTDFDFRYRYNGYPDGETLKACNTGTDPDNPALVGEYATAACTPAHTVDTLGDRDRIDAAGALNDPTATEEWYCSDQHCTPDYFEQETGLGSSWGTLRTREVVNTNVVTTASFTMGVHFNRTIDGTYDQGLSQTVAPGPPQGTKSGGLGDIEGCSIPIQIGNRTWLDLDNDGIQDPGEVALAGVEVTVSGPGIPGGSITVLTDADGNWYVGTEHGLQPNQAYTIAFDPSNQTTTLPTGFTNADLLGTETDTGSSLNGGDPDRNDSDMVPDAGMNTGTLSIQTAGPGQNNHSYDAGWYLEIFDLALIKQLSDGSNVGTITAGSPVAFDLTITNQGAIDATNVEVADYIPAGLTLNDPAWTATGSTATLNTPIASLVAGASTTVSINFTVDAGFSGTLHNFAEIAGALDGAGAAVTDIDSTPDSDGGNDNAPSAGNDPTDDEVRQDGKAGGDEDDHDVATLNVILEEEQVAEASWDLLKEVYAPQSKSWIDADGDAGTLGANDFGAALHKVGDVARYRITVYNTGKTNLVGITVADPWCSLNETGVAVAAGESASFICTRKKLRLKDHNHINTATAVGAKAVDPNGQPLLGPDGKQITLGDLAERAKIRVPQANLKVVKKAPKTAKSGKFIGYTITVRNTAKVDATNVVVTDALPAGMIITGTKISNNKKRLAKARSRYLKIKGVSNRQLKIIANGRIRWNLGTIKPGKTKKITLRIKVATSAKGLKTNKATAKGSNTLSKTAKAKTRVVQVKQKVLPAVTG